MADVRYDQHTALSGNLADDDRVPMSKKTGASSFATRYFTPLQMLAYVLTGLATVAETGDYDDLTNLPTLFDGDYNSLANAPTLGTAAALDVPASGNATSGQVVKGNDGRLADARTPTTHSHTTGDITGLGTAAPLNVAASGNAGASEVVKGNDGRLSDARTPTAHTHPQSDITNLVSDLAAKANTSSLATVATSGAYNDLSGKPSLGTAAALNVAASGNAASGEVVKGNDGRLTDARTPTNDPAPAFATLTDGATVTWAFTSPQLIGNATVTLGGNRTLAITGVTAGASGVLKVVQDGSGNRTLTLPAGSKVINGGAGAVSLSTAAGAIDILAFVYDGTNYFWTIGNNFS